MQNIAEYGGDYLTDLKKIKVLKNKSEMLKAIAHPMRLCILNCLMGEEECNVTSLANKMHTPQSTISQHLSKLKSFGLIEGERNGVEIQYRVVSEEVKEIVNLLLKDINDQSFEDDSIQCQCQNH